jgi:cytochrome b subunit of formate dehydrogenase
MKDNVAVETITQPAPVLENRGAERYYVRFSLAQRYLHGIIVVTFLGLSATGLPLRFAKAAWALAFANAVGGFGTILFFHKVCALALTAAFVIHVAKIGYRVVANKEYGLVWGPDSMVPRLKDIQDFFGNLKWFLWLGPKPKIDRYAYWGKVDYWAVFWGMGIIGLSGYAMWFAPFFARIIPGSWLNIALLIHGEEALLAVSFIFAIHFFNEHLRPDNFPMDLTIFTGRHSEEEFKLRHPEEYARLEASGQLESLRTQAPARSLENLSRVLGVSAILIGLVLLGFTIEGFLKE